jgi:hypothetical protein
MTRTQTGRIEAETINVLYKRPRTIDETLVALHRLNAIPPYWRYANVASVMRRLHARGAINRLDHPGVSRSILWWSG